MTNIEFTEDDYYDLEDKLNDLTCEIETLEIERSEQDDVISELKTVLTEARAQIDYLHNKFQKTGSGNQIIARIDRVLDSLTTQEGGE